MRYALGIDVGTTYTAAAIWREGRAEVLPLGNQANAVPSVLFLRQDGVMLVGDAAEARAVGEPRRVAREFKRRIGDQIPMFLGVTPVSAQALTADMIRWVVQQATDREGAPPAHVTLACPATWREFQRAQMTEAAGLAGLSDVGLVTEPAAAAIAYASNERLAPGAVVGVYDLGGGTFDATVLAKTERGFALRGQPTGDEQLGGVDFDQIIIDHVRATLGDRWPPQDTHDPAALAGLARLRADAVAAKELLSSDLDATISVFLPQVTQQVRITRGEFETAIGPLLLRTIQNFREALDSAGLAPSDLHAVLLVGGSSRIPLVAELIVRELGVPVALDAHPKFAICSGAAISAGARLSEGVAAAVAAPALPSAEEVIDVDLAAAGLTAATDTPVHPAADLPTRDTQVIDRDSYTHHDTDTDPERVPSPFRAPAPRPPRVRPGMVRVAVVAVLLAATAIVLFRLPVERGDASPSATPASSPSPTPPEPVVCGPQVCEEVLVALPYELAWDGEEGGLLGTGFTYVDQQANAEGLVPANLAVEPQAGLLELTTTAGIAYTDANTLDNALGVGLDLPDRRIELSARLVDLSAASGSYEQAGLWFGTGEDDYVKLIAVSAPQGESVQALLELDGEDVASEFVAAPAGDEIALHLLLDPATSTVAASFSSGGERTAVATFAVPRELFNADAAASGAQLGTRVFGGIFATHRNADAPLVYRFDDFSARAVDDLDEDATVPGFTRIAFDLDQPTAMVWGPDDRLYVTEVTGRIHALTLDSDKRVVDDEVITTLGERLALGIAVSPGSTPGAVELWVTSSNAATGEGERDSGTVTRLSGPGFARRDDVITGLPRALTNHSVNGLHFGPDGRLYIAVGSITGAGAANDADTEFGDRSEQPLSAALLVADVEAPGFDGSCAAEAGGGTPPPCDVVTYATGVRNMYDFVFHSNGAIYGPVNGLGVVGTFPPSPAAPCDGLANPAPLSEGGHNPGPQPDLLVRLEQGRYYGHPNPSRGECVFFDGTAQGVSPPANYSPPLHLLGEGRSANGIVEYTEGELLVANYSIGDDLTRLVLSADGDEVMSAEPFAGGFADPLPLALGPDGTIYVGELGGDRITALVPDR